jgi:NADPH-dependent glutamate synthase beta subunit-like oxidoreductase
LGRDLSLDELLRAHDAVLVALGCRGTRRLDIPGEKLPGVLYALPFLKSVRAGAPAAVGSRVVVVGGGDVAVDCAQTALRLGAQSVVVISLEGESDLPAHPNVVHGAKAEGIVFRGTWGPQAIQAKEGRLEGVRLKKCVSVFDERSNFQPVYDVCQTDFEAADTVIVAIGQTPERDDLEATGLIAGAGLSCDPLTLQAPDGRVFVAGDIHSGPSSVVHAMASGRRAAESIHRLLSGEDLRLGRAYSGPYETEFAIDPRVGSHAPRTENPLRTYHGAGDFAEMEQPLSPEAARREAGRCYSCGVPFGKFRTCWFCLPCEVECPHDALWVEIPYLLR